MDSLESKKIKILKVGKDSFEYTTKYCDRHIMYLIHLCKNEGEIIHDMNPSGFYEVRVYPHEKYQDEFKDYHGRFRIALKREEFEIIEEEYKNA